MRDTNVTPAGAGPIDFAEAKKALKKSTPRDLHETKSRRRKKGGGSPPPLDGRMVIKTGGGTLARNYRQSLEAIAQFTREHPFLGCYAQSGTGLMVSPSALAERVVKSGGTWAAGTLSLKAMDPELVALKLNQAAAFERFAERYNDWVEIDPPSRLCKVILATCSWPQLETITGTVEAPTLRPDGSLLDRPGFDTETGLLFTAGACRFPAVPDRPTKDQAREALDFIVDTVLDGFPFKDGAARSVALSAILTALVRRSLPSAPLHTFTAPAARTGKTLLATVIGIIATGRAPIMLSQTSKPEEEPKRLLGVLIEAPSIICYDNLSRDFQGDCLCTVLTEQQWAERLLGVNRVVRVSTATTMLATGNNLVLTGDLAERAIECHLDAGEAEPEARQFDGDLKRHALKHRAELVTAALTVMRGYAAAGRPAIPIPQYGGFEDWSGMVRKPLVWLGEADPIDTRARLKAADPVRQKLAPLLFAWRQAFGERSAAIFDACRTTDEDLKEALCAIGEGRDGPSKVLVGRFISRHQGRWETEFDLSSSPPKPLRALCFRPAAPDRNKVLRWHVECRDMG